MHELSVSDWRPHHFHTVSGLGVIVPHHCCWVTSLGCCSQQLATQRLESASVPHSCLHQMGVNAGMNPQLELDTNLSGLTASPCSPPSPWKTSWTVPFSSCQM